MYGWVNKNGPVLISAVVVLFTLTTVYPSVTRCRLNNTDIDECTEHAENIHRGQFHENFLANPTLENFDAVCSMYQKWLFCVRSSAASRCNGSSPSSSSFAASVWTTATGASAASASAAETGDGELILMGRSRTMILQTCTVKRDRTLSNLPCLSTQSRESNHLFNGCYVMMQLRRKSEIMELCRLMTEFLECEDRLIRSACGSALADFRLAVSMETALDPSPLSHQCLHISTNNYLGFAYTISCPPEFPELMQMCYREFMSDRIVFYPTLLAVVKSSQEAIDSWCKSLIEYRRCLRPIEQRCRTGVEEIYSMSPDWNKHLHISSYICEIAPTSHRRFLPSYQRAVRSSSYPGLCKQLYESYPPMHEMFAAKCLPNSTENAAKLELRRKLIDCYGSFIQRECGKAARDVIAPLIRMQYSFDFMPPCLIAEKGETERPPTVCACLQVKNEAASAFRWTNAFSLIIFISTLFTLFDCCKVFFLSSWLNVHPSSRLNADLVRVIFPNRRKP